MYLQIISASGLVLSTIVSAGLIHFTLMIFNLRKKYEKIPGPPEKR